MKILNKILHTHCTFISQAKLPNFIQLSLTLTESCHIKCDHLSHFYISPKAKNYNISATVWPISKKFGMQNCLSHTPPVEKFNFQKFKTADGWYTWRRVLHHHDILQFLDFQDGGSPPSWSFEIEIFNSLHFRDTFCIITLNFVEIGCTVAEILQFSALSRSCCIIP